METYNQLSDKELENLFFKEAGTKKPETKKAFKSLTRKAKEDALTLLREKRNNPKS